MTFEPGRKVATLFATKPSGAAGLAASGSRTHEVSCINKKHSMIVNPKRPTVHQNSKVHDLFDEMKAESVGPATLPKFKHQWNAVNARPLW